MAFNPLAQWGALGKSSLALARQWQDATSFLTTALLKTQLGLIDTRQPAAALQGYTDLFYELARDLAAQQHALVKDVIDRTGGCVDDLRRTANQDDIAIVLNGFIQDVVARVKDNAEQAATLLNSARAASTVLTDQALDGMAAAPVEPRG